MGSKGVIDNQCFKMGSVNDCLQNGGGVYICDLTLLEGINIYATGDHVSLSNPLVYFQHLLYFWRFGDGSLVPCVMYFPG